MGLLVDHRQLVLYLVGGAGVTRAQKSRYKAQKIIRVGLWFMAHASGFRRPASRREVVDLHRLDQILVRPQIQGAVQILDGAVAGEQDDARARAWSALMAFMASKPLRPGIFRSSTTQSY